MFGYVRMPRFKCANQPCHDDTAISGGMLATTEQELTHEQKVAKVHAFKIRCVVATCTLRKELSEKWKLSSPHLNSSLSRSCLKNCFWLLMLLYPGVCKKARAR
jgi:hypothetical protein